MKNKLLIVFDCLVVVAGVILTPFFFLKWKDLNFVIDSWKVGVTREGNAMFGMMLLGIGLIGYGVFDIWAFRRTPK